FVQQHGAGVVAREEHVAAAAQHQLRQVLQLGAGQQCAQLVGAAEAAQPTRPGTYAEGVVGGEVGVGNELHGGTGCKFTGKAACLGTTTEPAVHNGGLMGGERGGAHGPPARTATNGTPPTWRPACIT